MNTEKEKKSYTVGNNRKEGGCVTLCLMAEPILKNVFVGIIVNVAPCCLVPDVPPSE